MKKAMFGFGVAVAIAGIFGGEAQAASVTAPSKPAKGEWSFSQIFSHAYGGSFSKSGNNYSNGSVTAELLTNDETFSFKTFTAKALGRWAALRQSFGVITDAGYTNLFDVTGNKQNVVGEAKDVSINGEFRFARDGAMGTRASSKISDNIDKLDHLIAYKLVGLGGGVDTYVLFFEDRPHPRADWDFQDLVVQVTTPSEVIPSPAAAGLGLAMLGGALLRRRTA